jgi:outer membrane protein assembly factor BamB
MSLSCRLLCLLFLAVGLNACSLFDSEEESAPPADLVSFKASMKVRKAWSAGIGDSTEYLRLALVPASDGSRVFAAAHDGRVSAFEIDNGKRLWSVKTKLPISAGPAVRGDLLVMGTSNGEVLALSTEDGSERWQVSISSEVLAPPAVATALGLVMVRSVDGKLIALDAEDGQEAWFVQQSMPRLSVRGTGAPVIAGTTVLGSFDNGKVAAYALSDGSTLWEELINPASGRTVVERLADLNATLQVAGEDLYITGYQATVSAMTLETGQVLWARDISSGTPPATDLTTLYVTDASGELHAVARSSGREIWRDASLLNRDLTGPATYRNSVVVGDFEGYLHWFDTISGTLKARVRAGSARITSAPIVVNDTLLVMTDGGKLYAFRESGT